MRAEWVLQVRSLADVLAWVLSKTGSISRRIRVAHLSASRQFFFTVFSGVVFDPVSLLTSWLIVSSSDLSGRLHMSMMFLFLSGRMFRLVSLCMRGTACSDQALHCGHDVDRKIQV